MSIKDSQTAQSADRVADEWNNLIAALAGLAAAAAADGSERYAEVRQRAEAALASARARAEANARGAQDRVHDLASQADVYVRQNPWQAIGIGAGIGLIAGLLLSRKG